MLYPDLGLMLRHHRFNDCLRLGRRISEGPYLLPDPEILEPLNGTHPRSNRDLRLIGVSAHIDKNALTPPSSPVTRSVFKRHKIMLSKDLGINEHLESTILAIVESAGGHLVHSVKEADTLVCQYRESRDFREAGAADLVIGNLPWLYHIISSDSWTSPMRRLLHFPISQTGLPGFRAYRISLSNYNGDARLYLENLAKAAGCEFTKSMKQDNTHLITAHSMSEKCDAAKEWNIHMVNHLWLEDSYAKWAIQSVATSRYTHFPARTNLGEVVGQTEVDKEALKTYFLPSKDKAPAKAETTPATNTENKSKSERPDGTNRKPDVPKSSPALSHRIKDVNSTPATSRKGRRSVVIEDMSTPAPVSAGKENETPSTGGRSAKAKAMSNMAGYAEDFAKLAKEKKQKGGIIYGGRSSEDRVQSTAPKRSMSLESESGQEEPKPKRSKKANVEPKFKLLVTGYQDWSQDQDTFRGDSVCYIDPLTYVGLTFVQERLAQLGIELIEDPIGCSYLVAPKILRTKKFVCAMAGAPTILSINFALDCLTQDKLLNPKDYPLIDKVGEDSYHFKLADAVKRAKANQGHLLKGQTLFITQDVRGGPQTYRDIIEVNGGKCTVFKGRSTSLAIAEQSEDEMTDPNGFLYLISGTSKPETNLWPKFQEQVEAEGREARIVKTDWMLDIALSQKIRWDRSYEAKADES